MSEKRVIKKVVAVLLSFAIAFGGNNMFTAEKVYATSKSASDAISWVQSQVGTSIDYDGWYGAQCVDLIKAYYNYLGVTPASGNGCDYETNTLPSGWTRIQGATPQKGDILVYSGNASNPYGHVGIYESDYCTYHQNVDHEWVEKITYVKYNGFTNPYWGVIRPNWSDTTASAAAAYFTDQNVNFTNDTNAEVYTKIQNPNRLTVSTVGCNLYDSSGNTLLNSYTEGCGLSTSYVNYTCNFNTDMKYTLASGTTYKYQLFAVINGVTYTDSMNSFTTTGNSNSSTNTGNTNPPANNNTDSSTNTGNTNPPANNNTDSSTNTGNTNPPANDNTDSSTNTGNTNPPANDNTDSSTNTGAHTHSYVTISTTPATTSDDGRIEKRCSVCSDVSTSTIARIDAVTLSNTSYEYTGMELYPTVTVEDSNGFEISSDNYTVTYNNNVSVGIATVNITFNGNYSGSVSRTFTINPRTPSISKLAAKSKGFKITWKKISSPITGYQVQYSTSSKFTLATTTTARYSTSVTSATLKGLKAKKKYYVRIRTYESANGLVYYSSWSQTKTVKTKK